MSLLSKKINKPRVDHFFQPHHENHRDASPWRIFKIMAEFVTGFEFLRKYDRAVTFFGSARSGLDSKRYQDATKLAHMLAKDGFAVITGGGPGIMEAANKGAFEAGGQSVGLNIKLPFEQRVNKFVKDSESFEYFFSRKVMLSFASHAYIYFPGGYGTLNELFELVELVQTKKIEPIPIVLVGREFWTPLIDWIKTTILNRDQGIDPKDLEILNLVDSAEEAFPLIKKLVSNFEKQRGQ